MSTIKRYFVILRNRRSVPEKKGPFSTYEETITFLREAIAARPKSTQITVAKLTWDDDLWVDDGREMVTIQDAFDDPTLVGPAA